MTLKTLDFDNQPDYENMTPEKASELYVKLEQEVDIYRDKMKKAKRKQQDLYRSRIKKIKAEQNLLYPVMRGTGFVEITQRLLGMEGKRQGIYKRYMYSLNKKKKDR